MIVPTKNRVVVSCGNCHRTVGKNCNRILGVVAQFCNDSFLQMKKDEWCFLHGAAVSGDGLTAQVFLAPTGTGKSTLAHYFCAHGYRYCSDDLIIIDTDTGCLLPYPKPIHLRNAKFLEDYSPDNEPEWYRYRLIFADKQVKYPVFPAECVQRPVTPVSVHVYERKGGFEKTELGQIDAFRHLLCSSVQISDPKCHNAQLITITRQNKMDWLQCGEIDELYAHVHDKS